MIIAISVISGLWAFGLGIWMAYKLGDARGKTTMLKWTTESITSMYGDKGMINSMAEAEIVNRVAMRILDTVKAKLGI